MTAYSRSTQSLQVDIHVLEKSKSAMIKTIKKDFYKKEKKLQ
jgi:hypothetical protein